MVELGHKDALALKRLVADVEAGKIDVIVIYKLDRLSRSLLDFMKLVEFFEEHGTSIVSITQQINTSTSAGRMMINILMTFAQYEREVIAERVRDKVAGAKRRGKYCGGSPVIGYDVNPETKKLEVNEKEAELVNLIFRRYCETGSAMQVVQELKEQGYRNKIWKSKKGHIRGGAKFTPVVIYRILNSQLYLGKVTHNDKVFPGEHEAIVDKRTWEMAHGLLNANTRARRKSRSAVLYPLKGFVQCGYCGGAMTTSYTQRGNRRYIYLQCVKYRTSQELSCPLHHIPGEVLEQAVLQQLGAVFRTPAILAQTYNYVMEDINKEKNILLEKRDEIPEKIESLRKEVFQSSGLSQDKIDAIGKELLELNSELQRIQKLLEMFSDDAVSQTAIVNAFSNIETLWDELFPAEKHRIIRLVIEKVILFKEHMELEIKTDGITSLVKELEIINGEKK